MLQLEILSGKQAGNRIEARRFPFLVGRDASNDLHLEDDGVWNEHFQITSDPETGFSLTAHPGALVMINQSPVPVARLKNGDQITTGAVRIMFSLSPTRQRGLHFRECVFWALLLGVSLGQIVLIAWLLQQ